MPLNQTLEMRHDLAGARDGLPVIRQLDGIRTKAILFERSQHADLSMLLRWTYTSVPICSAGPTHRHESNSESTAGNGERTS
jgi:hypothetical protein